MMAGVEAVIFDLGRVLVDVDLERGLWRDLMRIGGGDPASIGSLRDNELLIRFHVGGVTPRDFHAEFCRRAGLSLEYDAFVRQWCEVFEPIPGMEALLRGLAPVVTLGLLSDTDRLHFPYCQATFPFVGRIPDPVVSYEVGATKPAPAMYAAAVDAVGVAPAHCLFVDDLQRNVDGALAFGMQAVLFTGADNLRRDLAELGVRF
jgi:putative hydrolase of the HAD superfamily